MDISFLVGLIFGILTQYSDFYLPYLLPFRPSPGQVRWKLVQYEQLYAGYHKLAVWYFAALIIGLAAAWDFLLRILRALAYPDLSEAGVLLTSTEPRWIIAALVAGYASAIPASQGALLVILTRRYPDYLVYRSMKSGYDKRLFNRIFPALLLCTVTGFVYYLATSYTAFGEDHVEIRRTFHPTLVYGYHDIVEIRGAKGRVTINGKTKKYKKGIYVIEFADGFQWHMWQAGAPNNPCRGYAAVAFAAARSRQAITGPDLQARCK